jgi:hypothetical protein
MGVASWLGMRGMAAPLPAARALAASGAAPVGYTVSDWVRVPAGLETTLLQQDAASIAGTLGVASAPRWRAGLGWRMWTLQAQEGDSRTRVWTEWVAPGVVYLVADRTVSGSLVDLAANRTRLRAALAPFGPVHQTVTVEGVVHAALSPADAQAVVDRALAAVRGRLVAKTVGRRWVVAEALAAGCGPPLAYGVVRRFNVEVSVSRGERSTRVYVGQPIVTVPY